MGVWGGGGEEEGLVIGEENSRASRTVGQARLRLWFARVSAMWLSERSSVDNDPLKKGPPLLVITMSIQTVGKPRRPLHPLTHSFAPSYLLSIHPPIYPKRLAAGFFTVPA